MSEGSIHPHESEARFHLLADAIPQLVWIARTDGAWEYVSGRWLSYTGRPIEAALGFGWREVVHPDDQDRLCAPRASGTEPIAIRVRDPHGSWRRFLVRAEPGSASSWLHVATPDEEGQRREEASARSAEVLAAAIDHLPIGLGITDTRGRVLSMNPAGLRLHGFGSIEEMFVALEQYQREFRLCDVDGSPLPLEEWPVARAARGEYVRDFEVRLSRGASGDKRRLSYSVAPIRDEAGEPLLFLFVIHDVTDRELGEARLRRSEQRYRVLFESIDDGFCLLEMIFDERGEPVDYRFLEANPAFERHTGLVGAIGRTARELVPDLDASWFRIYGRVATTGEPYRFENHAPAMGRWFDVYASRVGGPESRTVALVFKDITERKRAEEALLESEARAREAATRAEAERRLLDAVLEAAPAGIIVADANGKALRTNSANERLWGSPPPTENVEEFDQWKGYWADGSERHGRRIQPHEWAMARALRGEVVSDDVVEIEPFDRPGQRRTMLNSAAPVRDASGAIVRGVVVQMDITARIEAERALHETAERYRLIGRATNDVIWDWDLVTDKLDWNEAVVEHLGCTPEALGDSVEGWMSRLHPDDRDRVVNRIHAAIDGGEESWTDEYRFRKSDGSYGIFLDRGYIARDASGRAVRMIGSMLDLTERRAAEQALLESEARFRTLADNMSQLAWMTDETGYIFWYNKRWFDYTGTTLDEMKGWGWRAVHHPDHLERVAKKFNGCIAAGEPWEDTFPLRGKDGSYRWFLSRALPIRDDEGRVLRWFGTNTDITRQREAEEALREADRRKDQFLAMLAHELRNPLAPVRNSVHLLKKLKVQEPALERARAVIDRQVSHMTHLIDDLLDVSRIARGKIELRKERQDLAQLVRQTAEDYRSNLESSGLTLSVHVPEAPVWIDGDATRLAQSIGNLLHNARKFTSTGGRVDVHVATDDAGQAVVTVEDTGAGMEPALLSRLFDPFSQADQDLSRSQGGLGLGLALVKGLIELHGGTVEAHSAGLGKGSTFTLRLPLALPAEATEERSAETSSASGLRVIVIEDNADAAESLAEILALDGHEVEVALDGRAGIEVARAKRPDVVISDIGLPGGFDGYAVARTLREDPSVASAFLVALSGYSQEEDRRRSHEAGFDAHLAKPPDLDELEAMLAELSRRGQGEAGP